MTATITDNRPDPAKVEAWLLGFDRKLTDADITPRCILAAEDYAAAWDDPTFGYMAEMHDAARSGGLTVGQARGVLNVWRSRIFRDRDRAASTGIDLGHLPVGCYANPTDETDSRLFRVRVARNGDTYVTDDKEYGERTTYGVQRLGSYYTGNHADLVAAAVADPKAAAVAYGLRTGTCARCGARLEDPKSILAGIGPTCATRY